MDIASKNEYPSSELSNFAPHAFVFEGVQCASMEGLLQSFKFRDVSEQQAVCRLKGFDAKRKGREKNGQWHAAQTLWWKGEALKRDSEAYQNLLTHAFYALATNSDFREALLATGEAVLTHSIGNQNEKETVLTEKEFCDQLTRIRSQYLAEHTKRPRFT